MTILVYQIAIAAVILVASYFGRVPWIVSLVIAALWTVSQTQGALLALQLVVTAAVGVFAYKSFNARWRARRNSRQLPRKN